VLDGEIVALDEAGRPMFADLMFGRRPPIFAAFDVLVARRWIALADGVSGQGRRLFELVAEMDLEGIVAKRLGDPYAPGRTTWFKILNRSYSQKEGRSELFERG
jgi:ATP-dependent DNA ligase